MPIFDPKHFANVLREARAGSTDALGKLLEPFRMPLLVESRKRAAARVGLRLDRLGVDQAELVQETFRAAIPAFSQFRGATEAELLGWLRRILINQLTYAGTRYLKAKKRDGGRPLSLDQELPQGPPRDWILDSDDTPCTSSSQRERYEIMQRALERLKPKYQNVIALRNSSARPFAEIAAELGTTPEAVMKTWERALKAWRQEIEKLGLKEL